MNNSQQAQKGFKTFVLTLSVSLIVFSVIYYFLTSTTQPNDSEQANAGLKGQVQEPKKTTMKTEPTLFGKLAKEQVESSGKAVLAGATSSPETTQSTTTVPVTGMFGITVGLAASLVIFLTGLLVILKNPRKIALSGFEKRVTKDL